MRCVQPPCCAGLRGWWHTLVRAAPRWHHPDSTLRLASPPTFASFGLGALLLGAHSSFTRVPVGYATTLRIARTTPHTRTHALTPSLGCSGGSLVLEPPAHPPARPVGFERILGAQRWLRAFECRPHTCPGAEGAARVTLLRVRPALPSASDWAVQPVGHPRWGAVFQLCLWAL